MESIGLSRRHFLLGAAGTSAALLLPTSPADAAPARLRVRRRSTARWTGLDQSHNAGAPFPAGVADGPISFFRSRSSWQRDDLVVLQMHGNGNTYRHNGADLDTLSPGVWVYGPGHSQDDSGYAGIASIVRPPGTDAVFGFVHQEDHSAAGPVSSIGLVRNNDGLGYEWDHLGTILRGTDLRPDGFRGAELPSVVLDGDQYVMVYGNRFGNGRHQELWRATAPMTADGSPGAWTQHGPAFPNSGDPHFYAASASLRWSTVMQEWLCVYATDRAFRYRTSADLVDWSKPRSAVWYDQQYLATSGMRRWYPCLLDPSQPDSTVVADRGVVTEHQIDIVDPSLRWPARSTFRIR